MTLLMAVSMFVIAKAIECGTLFLVFLKTEIKPERHSEQMRTFSRTISYSLFEYGELSSMDKFLIERASEVRLNAQAPYSHYKVGAAVLSAQDAVHSGCNVENANWTATLHAEHNAIGNMIAVHGAWTKIKKIAIVAGPEDKTTIIIPERLPIELFSFEEIPVPCGHCLQIIWENCLEDRKVELISVFQEKFIARVTIGDALPFKFGPKDLRTQHG